jgi:hypothetical protein
MTRFYKFGADNYVNLNHVRTITLWMDSNGVTNQTNVCFADGTEKTYRGACDVERATATVLPAAPGWELLTVWFGDEEPGVLHRSDRQPIVGWHVPGNGRSAEPVIIACELRQPGDGEGCRAILRPDGVVVTLERDSWPYLNDWLAHVRGEWRAWWKEVRS